LNRFDTFVPVVFAAAVYGFGAFLEAYAPGLGTNGWQMLVWGFFISTTFLFHGTSCINSMAHLMGRRRFNTSDDSRNSFILAFVCLGEGWHNNHHRYQSCTRNGFYWWEFDITYYGLKALSWTGLIWGLKPVPKSIMEEAARLDHAATITAAQRAAQVHPEFSPLKKVVPTAAAIAVATATASQVALPKKADGPAIHRDVTEQTHNMGEKPGQSQPPST
jgi:stearoyl-CoA desaturase (delta-9 desaturase)